MPSAAKTTTETLVELLSHLVRFPTITSDRATNRAAIDWVEEQLSHLPLHVQRYDNQGFASLVATTPAVKDPKNPHLWLVAHIDVVDGPPQAFVPRVADGRLHGRGAHDMKFGLAIIMALLMELGPELEHYDLGLMITSDEEVGGYNGVKWLVDDLGYRGQAAYIPDCNATWKMEMGAKGIMWWELTATGRTSHAGRAWEGVNAIDELVRFVEHVRRHVVQEPCGDPNHQHATLNFASITGGAATNQVPYSATARLDIRFPPSLTAADVTGWIDDAAGAVPAVRAKALMADPPYKVNSNGAGKLFEAIAHEVTGRDIAHITAHGSSDARHFAHHGIPTINANPTGSGYHVPDEWVDIADMGRFYEVTRRFVDQWATR